MFSPNRQQLAHKPPTYEVKIWRMPSYFTGSMRHLFGNSYIILGGIKRKVSPWKSFLAGGLGNHKRPRGNWSCHHGNCGEGRSGGSYSPDCSRTVGGSRGRTRGDGSEVRRTGAQLVWFCDSGWPEELESTCHWFVGLMLMSQISVFCVQGLVTWDP